jgi:beta-phosphoglucomutase
MSDTRASTAVIFDLDGVLTDTAELHYQSWCLVAQELGIAFSRQQNEALRGVSRMKSCDLILGERRGDYSDVEKAEIARKKNDAYLALVAQMSAQDLLPGAEALLKSIRAAGMKTAVASASRNGHTVLARLGIGELLDVALDGNDVPASKPAPDLFLTAAEQMGVSSSECVVIEDAEVGVEAAQRAEMRVIGIGPEARVGQADRRVDTVSEIDLKMVQDLMARQASEPAGE